MALPSYTKAAIRAARLAGRRASRAGSKKVEPEHLLVALLARGAILTRVLERLEIDRGAMLTAAQELAAISPGARRTEPRLSRRMEKILLRAEDEAIGLGQRSVDASAMLLSLLQENGPAAQLLSHRGAPYHTTRRALRAVLNLPSPARCTKCGYDLRATPIQCPECGTMV